MIKFLKQLFCPHIYIDKCKIDNYIETAKPYQEDCIPRQKNRHCKQYNENNELTGYYCDYFYQECIKCGKIRNYKECKNDS